MKPRYPSIVVPIPDPPDVFRLSVRVGSAIRAKHPDMAKDWYQAALWAKSWPALLALAEQWVTLTTGKER